MREEPRRLIPSVSIVVIISLYLSNGGCESVPMRIVDEPNTMGFNNIFAHQSKLSPKVKPMELSGPPHLFRLAGRCWTLTMGIVWQGWDISNCTFMAMLLKEGDSCGPRNREVRVLFICGESNRLLRVAEPETCSYTMEFSSPLVCHAHALLVYPTLLESLRNEWDQLEQALYDSVINEQNYTKSLDDLFERAGLIKRPLVERGNLVEFSILETCNQEYITLQRELRRLQAILDLHDVPYVQPKRQTTPLGAGASEAAPYYPVDWIVPPQLRGDGGTRP